MKYSMTDELLAEIWKNMPQLSEPGRGYVARLLQFVKELLSAQAWTRTDDRLPGIDERVWVTVDTRSGRGIGIGWRTEVDDAIQAWEWEVLDLDGSRERVERWKVKFWIPLPDVPPPPK